MYCTLPVVPELIHSVKRFTRVSPYYIRIRDASVPYFLGVCMRAVERYTGVYLMNCGELGLRKAHKRQNDFISCQ